MAHSKIGLVPHLVYGLAAVVGIVITMTLAPIVFASDASIERPLPELNEIKSVNGILSVTLEATEQKIYIGKAMIDVAVYNGEYAGPVLRVHPGDTMKIRLINHLSRPTNLHFHGIDTSPRDNSDNIHILVQPGETFDYLVKIPAYQPPGLYWFHDHTHGIAEKNVMGGLTGTVIVEGFAEQFPALTHIKERLFVLKDYDAFNGSKDPYVVKYLHKFVQSINGQMFSALTFHPGETQLWRLTNQSADYYFNLSIPGHKFRVIGQDGVAARQETETDKLTISPAERLEVLVDSGAPGSYDLVSEGTITGDGANKSPNRILGRVIVGGEPMVPVATIRNFPDRLDLRAHKIDAYRTVVFSQNNAEEKYFLNGRQFDHNRIDTRIPLGNTEEWTLKNDSDEFHVFHIHLVSFQVTEVNGKPQPFNGYIDTIRIPERGSVKIRMAFTDPNIVGTFVYHCHVLSHEDKGMMGQIEVYDPKIPVLARFWRTMNSCCATLKFNGGCFWSNLAMFFSTLFTKSI